MNLVVFGIVVVAVMVKPWDGASVSVELSPELSVKILIASTAISAILIELPLRFVVVVVLVVIIFGSLLSVASIPVALPTTRLAMLRVSALVIICNIGDLKLVDLDLPSAGTVGYISVSRVMNPVTSLRIRVR